MHERHERRAAAAGALPKLFRHPVLCEDRPGREFHRSLLENPRYYTSGGLLHLLYGTGCPLSAEHGLAERRPRRCSQEVLHAAACKRSFSQFTRQRSAGRARPYDCPTSVLLLGKHDLTATSPPPPPPTHARASQAFVSKFWGTPVDDQTTNQHSGSRSNQKH